MIWALVKVEQHYVPKKIRSVAYLKILTTQVFPSMDFFPSLMAQVCSKIIYNNSIIDYSYNSPYFKP